MTRDDFEFWLFDMDDELGSFLDSLPESISGKLDYSLDSLLGLEAWVLENYESIDAVMRADNTLMLDRLSRYVGESIRKSIGGKWNIELFDTDDAYYCLPILTHEKYGTECPMTFVTACTSRREGDYIFEIANVLEKRAERE